MREASAGGGSPSRSPGRWAKLGAGALGFALFYALAFGAVLAIADRRMQRPVVQFVLGGAVVVALVVWQFPRAARVAMAVGFGVALVVFGGCLVLLQAG